MMYFASPQFLWLLLLVPVFPAVYGLLRFLRLRRIRRFGDETLVKALMPSVSASKGWWRIVLFSLAFAFFSIGLSRPLLGAKLAERETKGAEIMICLDVSNSMLARDYSPDRLSRAKLAISRLVDKLDGLDGIHVALEGQILSWQIGNLIESALQCGIEYTLDERALARTGNARNAS